MALREKLEDDIKSSMRSHDQARLDALRFFKNAVLAVEKEQKKTLDDASVIEVATKQASDRRDSIKAFTDGGRVEAAAKEAAELVVLEEFLPPQMSTEELNKILAFVEQLSEVDTKKARPMTSAVETKLHWREDKISDGAKAKDILKNAPETESGFFAVPKVLE